MKFLTLELIEYDSVDEDQPKIQTGWVKCSDITTVSIFPNKSNKLFVRIITNNGKYFYTRHTDELGMKLYNYVFNI